MGRELSWDLGRGSPEGGRHDSQPGHGLHAVGMSASDGVFRLTNIPPNPYHMTISASGFTNYAQNVTIRSAVPIQVKAPMTDLLQIARARACRRAPSGRLRSNAEDGVDELQAPSTDRNPRLAAIRFFTNRWSCSILLFK
jgi:hypothetical protein